MGNSATLRGLTQRPSQAQLLGLFVALAGALAPLLAFLPLWIPAVAVAATAWRWLAERFAWRPPRLLYRLGLILATAGGVFWHYRTFTGIEAGTALLAAMLALKLLETTCLRSCVLMVLLAYFLVFTGFLYDQSIVKAVYLAPQVLLLTVLWLHFTHEGALPWRRALRLSLSPLLLALPIAVVLFVLFPRIPGPLWGIPLSGTSAVTAMPETMTPGAISRLAQSRQIAFRAKFAAPPPPVSQLYWRGLLLHDFDGHTWSRGWNSFASGSFQSQGGAVTYEITLEPHRKPWLFALAMPAQPPKDIFFTADYRLVAKRPIRERRHYRLTSFTDYTAGMGASEALKAYEQRLPEGYNPRAIALAQQWREETQTDTQLVHKALAYFGQTPFIYTLHPPRLGKQTVDEFLFDTRQGFCEHFASAFTVLMRAAGIPARVVLGYQGGELNPVGEYFIVRQANAHAWSEVWLAGRGWVEFDPTAAVAPDRVAQGLDASLPAAERQAPFLFPGLALFNRIGLAWDALNHAWNQWFLGYGPQYQQQFLSWLGMADPNWIKMISALIICLAVVLAVLSLRIAWQLRAPPADPAHRLYQRFCRKLARAGFPRQPQEGPLNYACRVGQARPHLAQQMHRIAWLYSDIRYGGGNSPKKLQQLKKQVKRFRT